MKKKLTLNIRGRVQRVWFRSFIMDVVNSIDSSITGYVRNLSDGDVEAVFEGEIEKLELVKEPCKNGPTFARVEEVNEVWGDFTGEFESFSIK